MSKVIPFSQHFPHYHPDKGRPTYFVQKLWSSILGGTAIKNRFLILEERLYQLNKHLPYCVFQEFRDSVLKTRAEDFHFMPKGHTIRSGYRWKEGDMFSPRIWSGKPYCSKQIIIYDDIQIKKIWNFELLQHPKPDDDQAVVIIGEDPGYDKIDQLAKNDGLTRNELLHWFQYPKSFGGQILCWDEKINYSLINHH